jgi:hypothetical protein
MKECEVFDPLMARLVETFLCAVRLKGLSFFFALLVVCCLVTRIELLLRLLSMSDLEAGARSQRLVLATSIM